MRLIKKIASYNFAVLFASFAFFTSGLLLYTNHKAEAATTQDYTETYTATKWRNCKTEGAPGMVQDKAAMSLGPAAWTVSGRVGSTTFTEDWTVPASGWRQGMFSNWGFTNPGFSCSDGALLNSAPVNWRVTGLYGAYIDYGVGVGEYMTMISMPKIWSVTGHITTP